MKKAKTMNLKGNDYAKVADRLAEFRSDNPRGSITTTPIIQGEQVMFKTYILKDKSDPTSADATAHSLGTATNDKAFEKLETISVGRALALLGYLASGEIASGEEMEEYEAFVNEKRMQKLADDLGRLEACTTLDELKGVFMTCDMALPEIVAKKDEMKEKLTEPKE